MANGSMWNVKSAITPQTYGPFSATTNAYGIVDTTIPSTARLLAYSNSSRMFMMPYDNYGVWSFCLLDLDSTNQMVAQSSITTTILIKYLQN